MSVQRSAFALLSPLFAILCLALLASGCRLLSPLMPPQKGGRAKMSGLQVAGKGAAPQLQEFTQPENPKDTATQNRDETVEREFVLPPGSEFEFVTSDAAGTNRPARIRLAAPMPVREKRTLSAAQSVGAAQKDFAREISAKLAAARPVQVVGVLLVLAALAMFYPPVKAVTLSSTLQIVTGLTGLALIFAPLVIVGHEPLILGGGLALVAVWFVVHKHGRLQGLVDANKDGIDDRRQMPGPAAPPQAT